MEAECGRSIGSSFYHDATADGASWETHCATTAQPKFMWFQSGNCENMMEPMTCKSFTKVDCNNHAKVLQTNMCDDNNNQGAVGADEAGFCTCLDSAGNEFKQPAYFMCGQHEATSCQDYCAAKTILPAVTDMVMVSSADMSGDGEPSCPQGYVLVDSINKDASTTMKPMNADLNQGRDKTHWPTLFLCQSHALTAK